MKPKCIPLLLFTVIILSGCVSNYSVYEGSQIYQGHGGAKKVVDGVEIWTDGTPPRTFRIVGMIDDNRPKAVIPMAAFNSDMARLVKKHGGDAAIVLGSSIENVGTYFTPVTTTGTQTGIIQTHGSAAYYSGSSTAISSGGTAVAIRRQTAKIAIIKYE